jgi:murein DD-endopeptidase MepM/ murein hydrolase activator NlpD
MIGVAFTLLLLLCWSAAKIFMPSVHSKPLLADVAAFRVPYDSFHTLNQLALKYNIPFYALLTLYAQRFDFFPENCQAEDPNEIEQKYLTQYHKFKKKSSTKETPAYEEMFRHLLKEMEEFPIPKAYWENCVYSDSWGAARKFGGDRIHEGTDILDRDNVPARIPVASMTDGYIQELGWNELGGYRIGIKTEYDTFYYYAHLEHFLPELQKGDSVRAGQILGFMGNTGYGKEGTRGQFPVHLHVGISPSVSFTSKEFWINPYPFLRYLEEKN